MALKNTVSTEQLLVFKTRTGGYLIGLLIKQARGKTRRVAVYSDLEMNWQTASRLLALIL